LLVFFLQGAFLEPKKVETALYDQNTVSYKQNFLLFILGCKYLVY
jgi:hypothetical protein